MEEHLGRKLTADEEVDHVNGDCTDDRLDNYQILTGKENRVKAIVQGNRYAKKLAFECPNCGKPFEVTERVYKHNQIQKGCAGPFCSRKCSGLYFSK